MTIIIILAVFALLLGLLEVFVIPGFGLAGIGSIACALVDVGLIYNSYGLGWACGAVAIGLAVLGMMLYIVAHSRTFDRMSLHTAITSTNATPEQLSVKPGDTGTAITRLALVGNANIGGKQVEVKSAGDFIEPGTPIRVVHVNEATIIVEKTNK